MNFQLIYFFCLILRGLAWLLGGLSGRIIVSLESVIQNLKPKNQTQNIILSESPPKRTVTKKPHKFYVIFNGPLKGIYDEWHKETQFITCKNIIHQSYPTIDEA